MTNPLNPFYTIKLNVLFVYGADFRREMNIMYIPMTIQQVSCFILLFVYWAGIILWIIRLEFDMPRNDLLSSLIDCYVPVYYIGHHRMQHNWEKWFFVVLLLGVFGISSMFSEILFKSVGHMLNGKVNTFRQVAEINSPIYTDSDLTRHGIDIDPALRLASKLLKIISFHAKILRLDM